MAELSGEGTLQAGGQSRSDREIAEEAELNERQAKAAKWLEEKWTTDKNCPICRSINWGISDVVELRKFHNGMLVLNDRLYPVFLVICNVCGYTLTFNAQIAEIITSPAAPSPEAQDKERAGDGS
jgi:predicted nucleic-acid-binding Zn-ribbon protein